MISLHHTNKHSLHLLFHSYRPHSLHFSCTLQLSCLPTAIHLIRFRTIILPTRCPQNTHNERPVPSFP
jgi:hypothetical protein